MRNGDSILNYSKKENPGNLIFSQTLKPNCLRKSSSVPDMISNNSKYNTKFGNTKFTATKYTNTKYTTKYNNNMNSSTDFKSLPYINNNSTSMNFYNNRKNNYKIFSDLNNMVKFHSFNRRDYIIEAQKIIKNRIESKNHELVGVKNKTKNAIISDSKEISLNNYYIESIKNYMNNISLKESNYQQSLYHSKDEFENDYKEFLDYVEKRKNIKKIEIENFWKSKKKFEEMNDKYHKELSLYKKYVEDLEKKIKIISILKTYGSFVYKILGRNFWLDGVPDLDQKNKNFEDISDLILKKYDSLDEKNDILNEQKGKFDDTFLIIKYNDYEEKVLKGIKNKDNIGNVFKEDNNYEQYLKQLKTHIDNLKIREERLIMEKNKLTKEIKNSKNKRQKDENTDKYLEYIIELGKETQKCDIDENTLFEDNEPKEYEKMVKEYDYNYYTIKSLNDLKKKERLINKFIGYIENIENSEDKKLIIDIELERKNENKRLKLKNLKIKQQSLHENKNRKALERNAKFVVIGRAVPKIYQLNKSKNKKTNKDSQNKNDLDLLFYHDDE